MDLQRARGVHLLAHDRLDLALHAPGLLIGVSPITVRGVQGERADHGPVGGRSFGVTDIYWRDSDSAYVVTVAQTGQMTEDLLQQMVESVG